MIALLLNPTPKHPTPTQYPRTTIPMTTARSPSILSTPADFLNFTMAAFTPRRRASLPLPLLFVTMILAAACLVKHATSATWGVPAPRFCTTVRGGAGGRGQQQASSFQSFMSVRGGMQVCRVLDGAEPYYGKGKSNQRHPPHPPHAR